MERFIKDIQLCFNTNTSNNIINSNKQYNKKIKIDLKYLILYKFLNSFYSNEESVEVLNNFISYDRSSFYRQEKQIDLKYYENLNNQISKICNCHILNKTINKKYTFVAIDGTYSTGENYTNSLNMGYFDITNNIPIEIDLIGPQGKNREYQELMNKINTDINLFKNKVIVVDRAYFCYKFIHFLITNNIKFIIRCKGDCKNLKLEKITKDKELIQLIKKSTRIISYTEPITRTLNLSSGSKKNKTKFSYTIENKNDCVLITNLSKHFNNESILNFYRLRWKVETYFKLVKHNFNFEHLTNKETISIKKQFYCINIICQICKIFNLYLSKTKKEQNEDILDDFIIKCNETKLIRFIKNVFLINIIKENEQITYKKFTKDIKSYTSVIKYKKNQSNPRECKTPFMKWYIKAYSNQSEIVKILKAIEDNTLDKLNKNLKTKAKKIKILIKKINNL